MTLHILLLLTAQYILRSFKTGWQWESRFIDGLYSFPIWMVTVVNEGDDNILGFVLLIKPKLQKVYHLNIMYIHRIFMEIWFQSHPVFVLMYSSSNSFIRGKSLQSEKWFYIRVYHSTKIPWFVADFFFRQSSWKMSFGDIKESWMLDQSLLVMMYILHLFYLQITVNKNKMDELSMLPCSYFLRKTWK